MGWAPAVHLLPEWFDVDTEAALDRLRRAVVSGAPVPRRTRRRLEAFLPG